MRDSGTVEPLTVRLFVSTQTYDIPCDPRQPARWLLLQAKNIQRSNQSGHTRAKNEIQDELEVLYNRTRREVIELDEPIGRCIAAMDVIDARSLRQTPDTTNANALFPWLRSHPGGPKVHDANLSSSHGLFFQQLYAYTLIGRRTSETEMQRREKKKRDDYLDLLKVYVVGAFKDDAPPNVSHGQPYNTNQNGHYTSRPPQQQPPYYPRPASPSTPPSNSALHSSSARRASEVPVSKGFFSSTTPTSAPVPVRRQNEYPPDQDSDSVSDQRDEPYANRFPETVAPVPRGRNSLPPPSPSPPMASLAIPTTPVRRIPLDQSGSPLDEMQDVFDIVFKQQSIGMKLGADESKPYPVVKECFDGTEAKKYPEIQNGVVILAVNGQEVGGLGLSRVLYRLREAPRPVVVRFGRLATRDDSRSRMGTWG